MQSEHEIRVKSYQQAKNYINRAATLLLRDQLELENNEKPHEALEYVVFKASGQAIHTAMIAADVIRRKIPGLHQINRITNQVVEAVRRKGSNMSQEEVYDKQMAVFEIELNRNPSTDLKKEVGYMGVLDQSQVRQQTLEQILNKRPNHFQSHRHHHQGFKPHYRRNNEIEEGSEDEENQQNQGYQGVKRYNNNYNRDNNNNFGSNNYNKFNDRRGYQRENQGNNRRRFDGGFSGQNNRKKSD